MLRTRICLALLLVAATVAYAQENEVWRARPIAEWSEDDAKQVLTQSPWVKSFTPDIVAAQPGGSAPRMGRGGVNMGGVGLGIPGMGRRGMGYPAPASRDKAARPIRGPLRS